VGLARYVSEQSFVGSNYELVSIKGCVTQAAFKGTVLFSYSQSLVKQLALAPNTNSLCKRSSNHTTIGCGASLLTNLSYITMYKLNEVENFTEIDEQKS